MPRHSKGDSIRIATPNSSISTIRPPGVWMRASRSSAWIPRKKEPFGQYKNNGIDWRPERNPALVKVHDIIDREQGNANPYDVGTNTGWVSVGSEPQLHRGSHPKPCTGNWPYWPSIVP
jgi:hypothetical protein